MAEEKSVKLVFSDGSPEVSLPVLPGSVGPEVIDISTLYKKTGKFTYDPGFMSTASCKSAITLTARRANCSIAAIRSRSSPATATTLKSVICFSKANCPTQKKRKTSSTS